MVAFWDTQNISPTGSPLHLLNRAGRWLRSSLSRSMDHSLLQDGDPQSSLSSLGPPGEGCECWHPGWPLRQRSRWCLRFHVDLWDVSCCPDLHEGHTHGCAYRVFCSACRWPPRCICHQGKNIGSWSMDGCCSDCLNECCRLKSWSDKSFINSRVYQKASE